MMIEQKRDEPNLEEYRDAARRSARAGIADENAAYVNAAENDEDDPDADAGARSSEAPAEGGEDTAPRLPGSPGSADEDA